VRGDVEALGDLTVGRALDDQPDDRELGCGQFRPLRRRRVRAPSGTLDAPAPEQPPDTGRVPFGAGGRLQPESLVEVADRLVLGLLWKQSAGIFQRRRLHQRARVAAISLDSGQCPFGIIVNKCARVQCGGAQPRKARIRVRVVLQPPGDGDGLLPLALCKQQPHQLNGV